MTLAFWAGFATATLMFITVSVLAALRMAGLCSEDERRQSWSSATVNGMETCPECGVVLMPGRITTHHIGCRRVN